MLRIKAKLKLHSTVEKNLNKHDNIIHSYLHTLDGSARQFRMKPTSSTALTRPPEMTKYRTREQRDPLVKTRDDTVKVL